MLLFGILFSIDLFPQAVGNRAQHLPYQYDVRVELVGLFATVLDGSGKVVTDLNREDFRLFEEGKPQVISQFSLEYTPLSIIVLLDTSYSMAGEKLQNARKSILQFLKHLHPGDEAMLMEFRGSPRVVRPFTADFREMERDLRQLTGNGSTALYDAILAALDQMQGARNGRRAVLLISDGINTYGKARIEDTLEGLRRHGVELFTIGLETKLSETTRERVAMRAVLEQLTRSAGGEAFIIQNPGDLRRICNIISDQMHNQYSLAYYPRITPDGKWRAITLETRNQDFRVIASKAGYFALAGMQEGTVSACQKDCSTR